MTWMDRLFDMAYKIATFELALGDKKVSLLSLLMVGIILMVALAVSRLLRRVLHKNFVPRFKIDHPTEYLIGKVTHYVVMVMGGAVSLTTIGVDLSSLAFMAGLLSVGVGFGLQNVAANFVAGLILLFERPIQVGDWIEINGQEGEVREINLRTTAIETNDEVYIIVPNQEFISSLVINGSKGTPRIRAHVDVGVGYGSDIQQVMAILDRVVGEEEEALQDPKPQVWLSGFGDSSVDFRVLLFIASPRAKERIKAKLRLRIWWALKEAGVEIPFPQRDLHLRSSDIPLLFPGQVVPIGPKVSEA